MTSRKRLGPLGLLCGLLLGLCPLPQQAQDNTERKVVKKTEVNYPAVLKARGIGGTVRLKVTVHVDGTVKDVDIIGGNPALAEAAAKSVRQWRFAPGTESVVTVNVNFDPNA
jgi:TonB family protein